MPSEQELLKKELDDILEEFGLDDDGDEESNDAMAALNAEIKGTEFDKADSTDMIKMLGADNDSEINLLFLGWVRRRASRLVERLIDLARRHRNCPRCVALVTQAVAQFRAGRFPQAIATGTRAVRCFRSCAT